MDERTEKNKAWCWKLIRGFYTSCDKCSGKGFDPCYEETVRERYKKYKTVEEVEEARCKKCSSTGHWGWCDDPITACQAKDRIKDILGIPLNKDRMTAEESICKVLDGGD